MSAPRDAGKRRKNEPIDIIDRLPTPFGLVRGGVAPDHQHTKRVDRKYAETMEHESVRLVGNLALGRDVSGDRTEFLDLVRGAENLTEGGRLRLRPHTTPAPTLPMPVYPGSQNAPAALPYRPSR